MKNTSTLSLLFVITLFVSACSSTSATPTSAAVNAQNTAAAAAFTVIAKTYAAIPTLTSIHPTETHTQTPIPTGTPVVAKTETPITKPSSEGTVTAATLVSISGNSNPCNKPLQSILGGKPAKIKIVNASDAPITFSLFLNENAFGDCGYRGYALEKGGSTIITDLIQGCYSVSAFINDPNKPTKSYGDGCINNPDKWTFFISRKSVLLQGR